MTLQVSVAICTYNRASLLGTALSSLLSQTLPASDFEILVVDNGSTDRTEEVVAGHQASRSNMRYVREPAAGVAHARNRAAREARADYIAFLDDDARAEPDWLDELLRPTRELRPSPACVVGPVALEWEGQRPGWFPREAEPLLCHYDLGPDPRFLARDGYLLTTNALFHRQTLVQLGGFRPYLGRKRSQMLGGEDNDIYRRLADAERGIFYQPTARVQHGVPRERQTRRFLLRRLFWEGASQPLLDHGIRQARRFYALQAWRDLRRIAFFAHQGLHSLLEAESKNGLRSAFGFAQRLGRLRTHCLLAWNPNF